MDIKGLKQRDLATQYINNQAYLEYLKLEETRKKAKEEYEQMKNSILMTSRFLNAYCNGVINNNAMKNDKL